MEEPEHHLRRSRRVTSSHSTSPTLAGPRGVCGLFMLLLCFGLQVTIAQAGITVYFLPNRTDNDHDKFDFNMDDRCTKNSSYCQDYGADCQCAEEGGKYCCVCPSALEYTLRLAAGIAIILLVGVSIMLAFSLYRRAMLIRRSRRSSGSRSDSISSSYVSESDPPPLYTDINVVSSPTLDSTDFEKLPSYDEAIERLKDNNATTILVLSTEAFMSRSCEPSSKGDCASPPDQPSPLAEQSPPPPPPPYVYAIDCRKEGNMSSQSDQRPLEMVV